MNVEKLTNKELYELVLDETNPKGNREEALDELLFRKGEEAVQHYSESQSY